MKKEQGFTLVELAIVMIIIGLLIGGVLKGQQLIENAKVSQTISSINGFKAAYYSFRDSYGNIPGDAPNATARLSGCTTANNCDDGNGNAVIGDLSPSSGSVRTGIDVSGATSFGTALAISENTMFWKHLALADLITGVDPTAPIAAGDLAWGETNPSSPFGGGYTIVYANDPSDDTFGHFLRLTKNITGDAPNGATSEGLHVLNPNQAANIDRKMDDGMSNSGSVQGEYQGSGCDASGNYDEQEKSKNCWMLFQID